jgi:phytoene dehydrogenase-like protein
MRPRRRRVDDWLRSEIAHEDVRRLLAALFRLATYANSPDQSAEVAVGNLQSALAHGVMYLDHGWQTLVDGLRAAAIESGARIETGTRVDAVLHDDRVGACASPAARAVRCGVVAARPTNGGCSVARALATWAASAMPVRAACLDVGLSHLPVTGATFGLGVDEPLYASVHTAVAKLHPSGGALFQVAKYIAHGADDDARADERQLEGVLDLLQPGWRDAVVARRFLPQLVVSHALVTAAGGGLAGRPGPAVPVAGLFVAGDWVGREGLLFDASAASAAEAARLVLADSVRAAA